LYKLYGLQENGDWDVTTLATNIFATLNDSFKAIERTEGKFAVLPHVALTADMRENIASKDAHVTDHLFYVKKISQESVPLKLTKDQMAKFDKKLASGNAPRELAVDTVIASMKEVATSIDVPFDDIINESCKDDKQIKSMCNRFGMVLYNPVCKITSIFANLSIDCDQEELKDFGKLMQAKNQLFDAIDGYAKKSEKPAYIDLLNELKKTWDEIARNARDEIISGVLDQSIRLRSMDDKSVPDKPELKPQDKIKLCLELNKELIEK